MFKNTIAVGPLELVASCVTGGTAVASPHRRSPQPRKLRKAGRMPAALSSCRGILNGLQNAMVDKEEDDEEETQQTSGTTGQSRGKC
jgi:hypothetical protein